MDGGISAYVAIASAVVTAAGSAYGAEQSKKAAEVEGQYRANLLKRKRQNEEAALRENLKRRLDEKKRRLASVRTQQAASGFTGSGTQLAVFGEVENRLDERITEATNQSLDRIDMTNSQMSMNTFQMEQAQRAGNMAVAGALLGGATQVGVNYTDNYDRTGQDPFSVFN